MNFHWLPSEPELAPDGDPRVAVVPETHVRSVIADNGDFYAACTCGYLSLSCLTLEEAHRFPCPVELLLAESLVREIRLYARLVGH